VELLVTTTVAHLRVLESAGIKFKTLDKFDVYYLLIMIILIVVCLLLLAARGGLLYAIATYNFVWFAISLLFHCALHISFRFRPLENSHPVIGSIDTLEEVDEVKVEFTVQRQFLQGVLKAIRSVHPYEEPAIHIVPMIDYKHIVEKGCSHLAPPNNDATDNISAVLSLPVPAVPPSLPIPTRTPANPLPLAQDLGRPVSVVLEGLDGVGKSTVAKRLAQLLNAEHMVTPPMIMRGAREWFVQQDNHMRKAYYMVRMAVCCTVFVLCLCCAMLCYAVLCCAMLCYAVLCCAMLIFAFSFVGAYLCRVAKPYVWACQRLCWSLHSTCLAPSTPIHFPHLFPTLTLSLTLTLALTTIANLTLRWVTLSLAPPCRRRWSSAGGRWWWTASTAPPWPTYGAKTPARRCPRRCPLRLLSPRSPIPPTHWPGPRACIGPSTCSTWCCPSQTAWPAARAGNPRRRRRRRGSCGRTLPSPSASTRPTSCWAAPAWPSTRQTASRWLHRRLCS
jgi:hypothetical protein